MDDRCRHTACGSTIGPGGPGAAATGWSRRDIVRMGAAGAVMLGGASSIKAGALTTDTGAIDVHHHMAPPAYLTQRGERLRQTTYIPPGDIWSPQRSIDDMDKSGVRTSIMSISTPGVWAGDPEEAGTLARLCNEYGAKLKQTYRGRFGYFAVLPLPDLDRSLKELDYAAGTLDADGVVLYTNYVDKYLGDPAFAPLLEELNRRKMTAFVHPTTASCCINVQREVVPAIIEFPTDTARTVSSLLWSGSLSRFRDIKFIFSHGGGPVTMLADRISSWATVHPEIAARLPEGPIAELKRLHVDIVTTTNPYAIAAMRNLFSIENILFGTDYPWGSARETSENLMKLGLSQSDLDAVRHRNATRLMPHLA